MVADGKRLKQVIGNLLHNACKFTPENGRITLSVNVTEEDAGRCLQVSVADTGAGIAEEDQDRIFDRFQQVDSSYARSHGGLGLGLALVRKLVELHGGRVWVESPSPDLKPEEEGPGSKFVFVIPVDFLDETDLII
jgi:signal transduction histidine kinase